MEIRIDSLLTGAGRAEGTVVIIDVYRAFTTASVAFLRGAQRLILAAEVDDALGLRQEGVGDLTVGEVHGHKPDGFDLNNSPQALSRMDLHERTPILSTRSGTMGVHAARRAAEIFGAALINAEATAAVIRARRPPLVTLVAMGWEGRFRTDEDELCAIYLKNLLLGERPDPRCVRQFVLDCRESRKFDDPAQPQFDPGDREWALRINAVPFAVRVVSRDGMLLATPEAP